MDLIIVNKETGRIVAKVSVILSNINGSKPSWKDYCTEAWESAAEDKLVDRNNPDKYQFGVAE